MLEKITELRFERITPQPIELPERGPVNLVLRGPKGDAGTPGTPGGNGTNGTDGVDGDDGRAVEFQKSATHIQWRYVGDASWTNLVALTEIKGDQGNPGTPGTNGTDGVDGDDGRAVEFQKSATHIQWRYVGDAAWTNLVALADLKGDQGDPGIGTTYVESAPIVLTNTTDSNVAFAHGLGSRPRRFGIVLECVGADAGYSVGDRIIPGLFRSIAQALSVSANATEVTLSWDGTMFTSTTLLVPKAGGTASLFVSNPVNWRLVFWAET